MSNGHDRKSMDDVLASIRRIVRAEKEPDADAVAPRDHAGGDHEAGDEPLELTPDMRLDDDDDDDHDDHGGMIEPEAIARPARHDSAAGPATTPDPTADPTPAPTAGAAPDRETLRLIVREVLLEELASGAAEGAVRGIIRDELMNGELGGNISQNVLRLIQAEVAKALDDR